jgi:hypothetical protein
MLGSRAPLAALMVWIPYSVAALAVLVFGMLASRGLTRASSAAGTLLVLFCNIGLGWRPVLVFDNGSPLALIGYTDFIVAIGTFLVFMAWLERVDAGDVAPASVVLPGLLALTWCWYAPQNVLLAVPAAAALGRLRSAGPAFRPAIAATVFAAAVVAGATQLGPFLPRAWHEQVDMLTIVPRSGFALRPYVQYMTSHWYYPEWNIEVVMERDPVGEPHVWEGLWERTASRGPIAAAGAAAALVAMYLAVSLRVYFFAWASLVLLWIAGPRSRFRIALATFGTGFAIAFLFEYGGMKWWLTRFLGAGTAVSLVWGFEAFSRLVEPLGPALRRALLAVVLCVACYGPLSELAWVARENFVRTRDVDPLGHRLALLVTSQGPFPGHPAF